MQAIFSEEAFFQLSVRIVHHRCYVDVVQVWRLAAMALYQCVSLCILLRELDAAGRHAHGNKIELGVGQSGFHVFFKFEKVSINPLGRVPVTNVVCTGVENNARRFVGCDDAEEVVVDFRQGRTAEATIDRPKLAKNLFEFRPLCQCGTANKQCSTRCRRICRITLLECAYLMFETVKGPNIERKWLEWCDVRGTSFA